MTRRHLIGLVSFVLIQACGAPAAHTQAPPGSEWREFAGTWSGSGQRQVLPTEGARSAGTVQLSGAVVLSGDGGLGRGFRGEVIGFDDGADLVVLRAVWTDDRGDRVFSRLTGEPLATGRRFVGTIAGGTGRYAGVTGEYTFTWQYLVEGESGAIQGRTVALAGRVRGGGVGK